ncbi:MAG: class II aldolase/adducin family protein [Eubacteriales bacterium]
MKPQVAKELVVQAGKRLVESGLIARTWGNVSCRISSNMFVITPSGRDYLTLTPDEIVTLRIPDLSYTGDVKPSSEKGIHAAVYTLRPDIGFVIHTHQQKASAAGSLGMDSLKLPDGEIICAAYGLPGTKKLRKGVIDALGRSTKNALIMRNHGALCFGRDYQETFDAAASLEDFCEEFIRTEYCKKSNSVEYNADEYRQFALHLGSFPPAFHETSESERTESGFVFRTGGVSQQITFAGNTVSLTPMQKIHSQIYLHNAKINAIVDSTTPNIAAVAHKGNKLLPLLDDFAQIAGRTIHTVPNNPDAIARAFGGVSAVLVQDGFAVSTGGSLGDAQAVSMVMDKNCEATIAAALFGKIKPIAALDCTLMRFVYQRKYATLASKK